MKKSSKPKFLWRITSGFFAALACVFAFIWNQRRKLDYSEMGQYFDAGSSVTYSEQAVIVYGVLALLFLFLAIIGYVSGQIYLNANGEVREPID